MSRKNFECLDCRLDTGKIGEYYFIKTPLWLSIVTSISGMLCIGCLENRLKRRLTKEDFTDCYINKIGFGQRSRRLMERLNGTLE